jgi:hypothetical protein
MPPAAKKLREELSWSEKAAKQFNLQLLSTPDWCVQLWALTPTISALPRCTP